MLLMPWYITLLCMFTAVSGTTIYDAGNYTILLSEIYISATMGRYPLLEECAGMNYRCYAELYSMTYGTTKEVSHEALAVFVDRQPPAKVIAVSNDTSIILDYDFDNCDGYIAWIDSLMSVSYDETINYCGTLGDRPAVWKYLGISKSQFLLNSVGTL